MPYEFSVEEIIETFERIERGELALAGITEEDLQRMVYELQFRAEYCRIPPGYSSTGLQRVADRLAAALPALRRKRQEYEKEQGELMQTEAAKVEEGH